MTAAKPDTEDATETPQIDDDAGDDTGQPEEGETSATEAPEKYEFEFPEGMPIDESTLETATGLFKEMGLSQEQASKLVALQTGMLERLTAAATEQSSAWAKESENDSEFGGTKFEATKRGARNILALYGSEGLTKALEQTGMGNHPEFIRLLNKFKGSISEDSMTTAPLGGGKPSEAEQQEAALRARYPRSYDQMNSEK